MKSPGMSTVKNTEQPKEKLLRHENETSDSDTDGTYAMVTPRSYKKKRILDSPESSGRSSLTSSPINLPSDSDTVTFSSPVVETND